LPGEEVWSLSGKTKEKFRKTNDELTKNKGGRKKPNQLGKFLFRRNARGVGVVN